MCTKLASPPRYYGPSEPLTRRQRAFEKRMALPYGMWICLGHTVIFGRRYKPLYVRFADGHIEPADPAVWHDFKHQLWFFNDGNPMSNKNRKAILDEFCSEAGLADRCVDDRNRLWPRDRPPRLIFTLPSPARR